MEVPHLIGGFKSKFDQFVSLYKKTKEENEILKENLQKAESELERKKIEIQELNKKLQTNDLAQSFLASSDDNKEAKLKINRIVREIDNCIALLNR